jgi:hypothetical protein
MDILGGQNHVKLAVLLDDVALANRTGDDFQSYFFLMFWPGTDQDMGVPGPAKRFPAATY